MPILLHINQIQFFLDTTTITSSYADIGHILLSHSIYIRTTTTYGISKKNIYKSHTLTFLNL